MLKEHTGYIYRVLRKLAKAWLPSPILSISYQESNRILYNYLMGEKPFMVSRIGSSEMAVLLTYFTKREKELFKKLSHILRGGESCWTTQLKEHLCNRSGFYCDDEIGFEKFSNRYLIKQ